jgi:hypothetical protein
MQAPNSTDTLLNVVSCAPEDFKFTHLLLNHRVQWYMMYSMLQKKNNIEEMWAMYRLLFDIHSSVEEKEILAALVGHDAKQIVGKVHSDHEALESLLKDVEEARLISAEKFGEKLILFAAKNHQHTLMEERDLLPLCQKLDVANRDKMTRAIRDHFRAQNDSAWLILSMRDVAVFSGDGDLWDQSMPWFFRNVVAVFLSTNATYVKYTELFPPESAGWLNKYAALLATATET